MKSLYLAVCTFGLLLIWPTLASAQAESVLAACKKGVALFEEGNLRDARPILEDAVKRGRVQLPSNNAAFQTCLNNLGNLYTYEEQFDDAETVLNEAIRIDEDARTSNYFELSRSLSYQANNFFARGRTVPVSDRHIGLIYAKRAINIIEENAGRRHPSLAFPLSILANYYSGKQDCDEARPILRRALEIIDESDDAYRIDRGKVHASMLLHLAVCRFQNADLSSQSAEMRAQLSEIERCLPSQNPSLALALGRMGWISFEEKRFEDAEKFFLRARSIGESTMGPARLAWIRAGLRRVYFNGHAFYLEQGRHAADQFQQKLEALDSSQ